MSPSIQTDLLFSPQNVKRLWSLFKLILLSQQPNIFNEQQYEALNNRKSSHLRIRNQKDFPVQTEETMNESIKLSIGHLIIQLIPFGTNWIQWMFLSLQN